LDKESGLELLLDMQTQQGKLHHLGKSMMEWRKSHYQSKSIQPSIHLIRQLVEDSHKKSRQCN
jgi:hypothetical protein